MSIPRSAKRSSTFRSDSGYRTYIITTRRITSGELLKYRNGFLMARSYHSEKDGRKIWSDIARAGRVEPGHAADVLAKINAKDRNIHTHSSS
jgi:hypothetical protein